LRYKSQNIMTAAAQLEDSSKIRITEKTRIDSIDLLRGLVMIIMALDHVRDYFHADAFLFNPLDLGQTNVALFFTRWITHFCAPVFVFLAGTSAYFVGKRRGQKELSSFLIKRGVWLVFLELTVINFAWFFNIEFSFFALTVIWALGIGMILLGLAVHLPYKAILVLGLVLVAGHNLLDTVHAEGNTINGLLYAMLHDFKAFQFGDLVIFVGYPILPWTGIMFLGYTFGKLYTDTDATARKKFLVRMGFGMIVAFIALRLINGYGDPSPSVVQNAATFTFLSFINVTKYPPSLFYVLAMLGPAFLFLAVSENWKGKISKIITALGRVPMFYYITHLYLIHILAVVAALATGYAFGDMIFTSTWVTDSPQLKGYGFNLLVVYVVWISVVVALLPFCLWYDRYKTANKNKWWLSYL
jgi:uncharacterized membrane protein